MTATKYNFRIDETYIKAQEGSEQASYDKHTVNKADASLHKDAKLF